MREYFESITNELFKNTNSGQNNEEAKKKIDAAHVYAAKALSLIHI